MMFDGTVMVAYAGKCTGHIVSQSGSVRRLGPPEPRPLAAIENDREPLPPKCAASAPTAPVARGRRCWNPKT